MFIIIIVVVYCLYRLVCIRMYVFKYLYRVILIFNAMGVNINMICNSSLQWLHLHTYKFAGT